MTIVITIIVSAVCGIIFGAWVNGEGDESSVYLQQLTAEHLKRFDELRTSLEDFAPWAEGASDLLEQWLYHTRINTTQEIK